MIRSEQATLKDCLQNCWDMKGANGEDACFTAHIEDRDKARADGGATCTYYKTGCTLNNFVYDEISAVNRTVSEVTYMRGKYFF